MVVACVLLGAAWWLSRPAPVAPAPTAAPVAREKTVEPTPAPKVETSARAPEPERPSARRERTPKEKPAAPVTPEAPASPVGPTLVVFGPKFNAETLDAYSAAKTGNAANGIVIRGSARGRDPRRGASAHRIAPVRCGPGELTDGG